MVDLHGGAVMVGLHSGAVMVGLHSGAFVVVPAVPPTLNVRILVRDLPYRRYDYNDTFVTKYNACACQLHRHWDTMHRIEGAKLLLSWLFSP